MTLKHWIAGTALALASSLASASGFYVGGGAYDTSVNDKIDLMEVKDNAVTPAVFVGYRPINMLGVELGYYDLGRMDDKQLIGKVHLDGQAATAAAVLTLPLGLIDIYGKAGVAYVDGSAKFAMPGIAYKKDLSGTDPFVAAGVALNVLNTLYVYTEYQRIESDVKFDMVGVGVRLDF